MNIPSNPNGIQLATLRFEMQSLNKIRHIVPPLNCVYEALYFIMLTYLLHGAEYFLRS
jgi:hypothetical protein